MAQRSSRGQEERRRIVPTIRKTAPVMGINAAKSDVEFDQEPRCVLL
jgi:hypothetical protein